MKKFLLFALFFITGIVYGQKKSSEKFRVLVEPYTFSLPVQELSLSIPAYMGFMTPKLMDEKTKTQLLRLKDVCL